jgi:hypothetical protein
MNQDTPFDGPRGAKGKRARRSRSTWRRKVILVLTFLLIGGASSPLNWAQIATQVPENANPATLPPGVKPGMIRYVSQPNGWGRTKEEAIKDLHVRIFPWYERNFGKKPGFEIDWVWVSCVEVSAKRSWQADGRLWWYVEPVKGRLPERPARSGRFDGRR